MSEAERSQSPDKRWLRIAWGSAAALVATSFFLGFFVLGRYELGGPTLSGWAAICRAIGLTAEGTPRNVFDPPVRTPTRIAWTSATRERIASGNPHRGEFVAMNCVACHGPQGVSGSDLFPTLAGMDPSVIYKQLDDFRSGKRLWGVMGAMASALTDQDSADVAAYFATRPGGLEGRAGAGIPTSGRSLRQSDPILRLAFAGDPERGIPPCAACHGPAGRKLGAPPLERQRAAYIERQLVAFAQGTRQNDINEQMRTIAAQLTADEMHGISVYYGSAAGSN